MLPEVLRDVGGVRFIIIGVLFVVLMIFRPFGILGARQPERSLHRTLLAGRGAPISHAEADAAGNPARTNTRVTGP
jgi:hypothetical protein